MTTNDLPRIVIAGLLSFCAYAFAEPTVVVDAIPTGASFVNYATVKVPIADLSTADVKEVEAGLASSMSSVMAFAEKNGVSHICLLSAAGNDARSYKIDGANASLRLRTQNPSFIMVLYRQGGDPPQHLSYSMERPEPNRAIATVKLKKVAIPQGWTTDAWVYFNLPRIQAAALRAGATQVFLEASGSGATSAVVIPGLEKPFIVFSEDATISASWYASNDKLGGTADKR